MKRYKLFYNNGPAMQESMVGDFVALADVLPLMAENQRLQEQNSVLRFFHQDRDEMEHRHMLHIAFQERELRVLRTRLKVINAMTGE